LLLIKIAIFMLKTLLPSEMSRRYPDSNLIDKEAVRRRLAALGFHDIPEVKENILYLLTVGSKDVLEQFVADLQQVTDEENSSINANRNNNYKPQQKPQMHKFQQRTTEREPYIHIYHPNASYEEDEEESDPNNYSQSADNSEYEGDEDNEEYEAQEGDENYSADEEDEEECEKNDSRRETNASYIAATKQRYQCTQSISFPTNR
jgi:hypothetical protein